MYSLDYIKTLIANYDEWDNEPGSAVWRDNKFIFEDINDDVLNDLVEIEDEVDFIDAIRELIQEDLAIGTVKSFYVKDLTGKIVCEYDDGFW